MIYDKCKFAIKLSKYLQFLRLSHHPMRRKKFVRNKTKLNNDFELHITNFDSLHLAFSRQSPTGRERNTTLFNSKLIQYTIHGHIQKIIREGQRTHQTYPHAIVISESIPIYSQLCTVDCDRHRKIRVHAIMIIQKSLSCRICSLL